MHKRRCEKESEKHAEKKSAVLLGKHTSEVKKEKKNKEFLFILILKIYLC